MHRLDELTGLPNRRSSLVEIGEAILHCRRELIQRAAFFFDLKKFSAVNDSYGHYAGDAVLIEIAERIKSVSKDKGYVAHIGGDKFLLLLKEYSQNLDVNCIEIRAFGEELLNVIDRPIIHNNDRIKVSSNLAVVIFDHSFITPNDVLSKADATLYNLKNDTRINSCLAFFEDSMLETLTSLRQLENELVLAFENNDFTVFYQPQVCVKTNQIVGAEALLRWRHPRRGLIPADDFIVTLQNMGIYPKVSNWIFKSAISAIGKLAKSGLWQTSMRLSINVTAKELSNTKDTDNIKEAIKESGLAQNQIKFEILETIGFDSIESAKNIMSGLIKEGFDFALDDFGTGYSSLMYLYELPFSTIKIDKQFVIDMMKNGSKAFFVKTFISLARDLNISVIAEGVESRQSLEVLKEYGCDEYQGYFFSKPLAYGHFSELLKNQSEESLNRNLTAS